MGLITKYKEFKQKRNEKAIAKNLKLVSNPKAIREDRAAALDYFKYLDEPEIAVPALLKRFDFSLEHGINDTREKETAMEGILAFKEKSLPFIVDHLKRSDRIAWPIKAFKALASDEQVIAALTDCLDFGDISFDQKKVDKNYDILCYLRDYQLPASLCLRLFHFLDDLDERVRFAAVEALLEQKDASIPEKLEVFLKDESAENTRIRQSVISAFVKNKWTIRDKSSFSEGYLVPGVAVSKQYQLVNQR